MFDVIKLSREKKCLVIMMLPVNAPVHIDAYDNNETLQVTLYPLPGTAISIFCDTLEYSTEV